MLGGAVLPSAQAQSWFVQPTIRTEITATNNSGYTESAQAQSDVIVSVSPGVVVRGDGPRLKVNGAFRFDTVGYVSGTQGNRILPSGSIAADATLIDQWLFMDAAVIAARTATAPLGPRPEGVSSYNTQTTTQWRLNPRVQREFAPNWVLSGHADNTWVRTHSSTAVAGAGDNAYVQRQLLSVERKPVPLGVEVQIGHEQTRYSEQSDPALEIDRARTIASYAFTQEFILGAIGGYERSRVPPAERWGDQVYGVRTRWAPDERTRINATLEHRFFGTGWDALFEHRTPFHAWTLNLARFVSTYASSVAALPAGSSVDRSLDSILTTRYTDPVQRSQEVQRLKALYGLPDQLADAVDIYAETASIEQVARAAYTYTGRRDVITLAYYFDKRLPLQLPHASPGLAPLFATANAQHGLSVAFGHRLTPRLTLDAMARWSMVAGRGAFTSDQSRERAGRLGVVWQVAPATTGMSGLRWQRTHSSVNPNVEETALYLGLDHRF